MKNLVRPLLVIFLTINTILASAQALKIPPASSSQTIMQGLGLGTVTLTYSRPNVKGRKIFGDLEPYGKVWRTGANTATVIKFSEEVKIEGNAVPAGEYGLFTIPGKDEWTVIISKAPKQWGAYTYKEADDLLRFTVKPDKAVKTETFTMQFTDVTPQACMLSLMWDKVALSFNLTTDFDSRAMASIDEAMRSEKKPYTSAAQYYYNNGKDLSKALEWITAQEAAAPKSASVKLWKARIQLKMGDKKAAAATAAQGAELAKADNNDEYVRLNTAVIAEAK